MEAAEPANAWNKPIPSAVKFWKDYALFGRVSHPTTPVFINTQKGSRAGGVWPSYYDNQLRSNPREPRRKRVQIVHMDTSNYVSLFVKKVAYADFVTVVKGILEDGIMFGKPGGSWQSVQIKVPAIDPCQPLEGQTHRLDEVFRAAERLYEFFIRHETALLGIPVSKK
jgi:hypothetical protein